jgi:hypothetical protein
MKVSRIIVTILTTIGLVSVPSIIAAPAANADSHKITHPTSGVTCNEWIRNTRYGNGVSYWGKCTGRPTGVSRDYRYREVIRCQYPDRAGTVYGAWKSNGTWSNPRSCPSNNRALSHRLVFQWL